MVPSITANAGNDDRRGTAGASYLLINPWVKSSGWSGVNTANGSGVDALFSNVAGLAHAGGTEVTFGYTSWLQNSGISNIAAGLAQNLGEYGVLGLSVSAMNFGTIERTTVNSPEVGNNGTFQPSVMNVAVSYAKAFSTSIYAGATVKLITESIDNVTGTGFAIDAGVQYVTGENYELKFGIALKNWGPSMSHSGDGLSINALIENSNHYQTLEQRSASFELPSSLNIGMSYDILFAENNHRVTVAGNFASMAFGKDQYTLGLEYGFMKLFMLRAGYTYEADLTTDIYDENGSTTLMNGLACGASVMAPLSKAKAGKNAMNLALDYSFRLTKIMGGIHSVGISFSL
jgi:hypothetical protein